MEKKNPCILCKGTGRIEADHCTKGCCRIGMRRSGCTAQFVHASAECPRCHGSGEGY